MADKKISQLDSTTSVNSDAVFPLSQLEGENLKTVKGTVEQIGDYIAKVQDHSTLNTVSKKIIGAINEIMASGDIEGTASGSVASFNDGGDNIPVKSLVAEIDVSTDGFDSVEIGISKENIWNEQWEEGTINASSGLPEVDPNRIRSKDFILCRPSTSYYALPNVQVFGYDEQGDFIGIASSSTSGTVFTTPANCHYLKFRTPNTYGNTYNNDLGINYPSTVTTYKKYIGSSYSISLGETLKQGGSLNVTTGLLTRTDTTTKQLSTTEVRTLLGDNNIYANSGNVSLVYFTNKANEIAELVEAEIASVHTYSTTERVVGKWIDGKPIYEKTFTNIAVQSSLSQLVDDSVSYGTLIDGSINIANGVGFAYVQDNDIFLRAYVSGNKLYVAKRQATDWAGSSYAFIYVKYTKSTD